ncbi:MAG: stage II sporulation protein P [Ruminococcus sp.]|nr:stage II sporulation protein P [Ruminococcus sp.]
MKAKGKALKALKTAFALVLLFAAAFCVIRRLPECFTSQNPAALAAAAFVLADGKYRLAAGEEYSTEPEEPSTSAPKQTKNLKVYTPKPGSKDKSGYYDTYGNHESEESYSIVSKTVGADGTPVGDCFVKNKTGLDFDFEEIMSRPLTFKAEKNTESPQVLIYHTHTGEAYLDESVDYYYESYYSRTQNEDYNVVAVGEVITRELNKRGISTYHEKTVHDSTYNGSYDRSTQTVEADMKELGDVKVVLDIHRDAIGSDTSKVKPVFEYNGRQGAQIMILSGCDYYGEMDFDHWENNLSFALKLQNTAEKNYPGMTRPLSFDYFVYNEHICDGSLLIEIGSDANSIEEAEYTAGLLADVIAQVLTE